jgi:alginate O-acetyltransferase complex protein AlgI
MAFLDFWYVIFLILALTAAWLLPRAARPLALLGFCLVFHWHYAGPAGMRPILVLAAAVYLALRTESLIAPVGAVCVAAWLFYRQPVIQQTFGFAAVVAPLAISFFTFEFLHLLIDRATGRLKKVPGPRDYLLFLLFFPSLASGPIKRYPQFQPQLAGLGWPGADVAATALVRVLYGFFLKLVVSSWFLSLLPRNLVQGPFESTLVLGIYCYGYVVCDLTAYSHIAIGSARLMGITLPENVRPILVARSFSDYWSRWHMSVTQWFRDYVLWPVAGSDGQLWRFYLGVGTALFLSAIWHGSGSNILLWGAINAGGVVLESWARRTHLWRRVISGPAAPVVPWIQWTAFQLCLMILAMLFLFPTDHVAAQLAKGW